MMDRIKVSAYPVWKQSDNNNNCYFLGLRFANLNAGTVAKIEKIRYELKAE